MTKSDACFARLVTGYFKCQALGNPDSQGPILHLCVNPPLGALPGAAPQYGAGAPPVDSFASATCTESGTRERQTILCQNRFSEIQPGSVRLQPEWALGWVFARGAPVNNYCYLNFPTWECEASALVCIKLEIWFLLAPRGCLCGFLETYSVLQFKFSLATSMLCSA